jgi:hypothetical protein
MELSAKLDLVCEKFGFYSITCLDKDGCVVFSSSRRETNFNSDDNLFLEFEDKEIFIESFKRFNLVFGGKDLEINKILKISNCLQKIVNRII